MIKDFKKILYADIELVNKALAEYMNELKGDYQIVCDAMKYSVENGGKRLRPILAVEFCRLCGGDAERALPFACAIEMVHTYSLIHDDLPCMDDDDMRRGKPACHIAFGEEYALLAGDALLTLAFKTIASSDAEPKNAIKAVALLSENAGINGMIGGQGVDLMNENKHITLEQLKQIHRLKTGALIECASLLGCIAADASDDQIEAARSYSQKVGVAFQIMDDILDVVGDSKTLGKPVGSDEENNKSTYVTLMGLSKSRELVKKLTAEAKSSLDIFGEKSEFLKEIADFLSNREN